MSEDRTNDALEKLNQGIQESKQMVQRQTIELAQELMDNYAAIEQALNEAQQNVADLDTESLVKQGEIEATDAARREARELDVDLTQVQGTGSEGRITVDDVKKFAGEQAGEGEAEEEETEEEPRASDAARRRAEEIGVDLSQIEGTGSDGLITVKDVTNLAKEMQDQATDTVQRTIGQAAGQADGAVDQATEAAGQATSGDGPGEPKATNAARRKAEELGIDLSQIEGSGAGGLITIRDVVQS